MLLLFGASAVIFVTDPLLGVLAILQFSRWSSGSTSAGAGVPTAPWRRSSGDAGSSPRVAHESFDGAVTVRALGREEDEAERFAVAANDLRDALVVVGRTWTGFRAATEAVPNVGDRPSSSAVGILRVIDGDLGVGELVARLVPPLPS